VALASVPRPPGAELASGRPEPPARVSVSERQEPRAPGRKPHLQPSAHWTPERRLLSRLACVGDAGKVDRWCDRRCCQPVGWV